MKLKLSNFLNNLPEFFEKDSNIKRGYTFGTRLSKDDSERYYSNEINKINLLDRVLDNFNYYQPVFNYTKAELQKLIDIDGKLIEKDSIRYHLYHEVYKFHNLICRGCEESFDKLYNQNATGLCYDCDEIYDNKTGYCSLSCCLGGGCDGSC